MELSQITISDSEFKKSNSLWLCEYSRTCFPDYKKYPWTNIKTVINLHMIKKDNEILQDYKKNNIMSFDFPIRDDPTKNILGVARHVFHTINRGLINGDVVIHCRAGVSRSPAVVAYYLTHTLFISLREALNKIKETRPFIDINIGFWNILYLDAEIISFFKNEKICNLVMAYIG